MVMLRDIVWGGRVRRAWQSKIWEIAQGAATSSDSRFDGNMVSSSQTTYHRFLDGGVSDTRGFFDSSSGMRIHGKHSQAYILYRLGLKAKELIKGCDVPSLAELEKQLGNKVARRDRPTQSPRR